MGLAPQDGARAARRAPVVGRRRARSQRRECDQPCRRHGARREQALGEWGAKAGRGGGWWLQATQRGLQQEQIEALGQALAAQADSSAARLAECTQEL